MLYNPLQSNKKKQFHWKIVHRAVYCETRLARMGKSNGICRICNDEEEDIVHMLIHCKQTSNIWQHMVVQINELLNLDITFDDETKLFGAWTNQFDCKYYIVNLMIVETLWQIWKNRNNVKYGNKPTRNIDELFKDINAGFKEELKCFRFSN